MIRFLRNLLITLIIVVLIAFIALLVLGNYFIDRAEGPITAKLIGVFAPGDNDDFGYTGGLRFIPFRITVNNLYVESDILKVGGVNFDNARVDVEAVECDALKLIQNNEVEIISAEGRSFSGSLTYENLATWLELNSEHMKDVEIQLRDDGRCGIIGRFGMVSAAPMMIIGEWGVDDRGVATLLNADFHNPDSPVPAGMIDMIRDQVSFDIRIRLFDEELTATTVSYDRDGITITASQSF